MMLTTQGATNKFPTQDESRPSFGMKRAVPEAINCVIKKIDAIHWSPGGLTANQTVKAVTTIDTKAFTKLLSLLDVLEMI